MLRNAHKMLARKPEGKGPLGRPKHRWEDHIKCQINRVEGCRPDASGSEQGPMAGTYYYGNELSGSTEGGEFLNQLSK